MKNIQNYTSLSALVLSIGCMTPYASADTIETVLELSTISGSGEPIPMNGAFIPDLNTIEFSFQTASGIFPAIQSLTVQLAIRHEDVSDLQVYLIPPEGSPVERLLLAKHPAFSGEQDYRDTIFSDDTPGNDYPLITEGIAPFIGRFNPIEPLSTLAGMNPNGVWKLRITDNVLGLSGTIYRPGSLVQWGSSPTPAISQGTKITIVSIPEPASVMLLAAGAGLMLSRRRA